MQAELADTDAGRPDLHSLEHLLRSSLAVAQAHARNIPDATAAAAAVLLQPQPAHPLDTTTDTQPLGSLPVDSTLVQAALTALQQADGAGRRADAAAAEGGFAWLLRDCGGDPFQAAVCVAADDVAMHAPAELGRCGEARRAAWEVQVHSGMCGRDLHFRR